jgi:hypothetical protein
MKNVLGFVLIVAFFSGCKYDPVTPTDQPQGTISGTVVLHNEEGDSLQSDGVLVSLAELNQTAMTDASGNWSIQVPKGTYTISLTKQGYGMMKIFDVITKGNDTVATDIADMTVPSSEVPTFQMLRVYLGADSTLSYFVQGKLEQKLAYRSLVLCLSTDSTVIAKDPNTAKVIYPFLVQGNFYEAGFDWSSTSTLGVEQQPFAHGTKVYATLAIYGGGEFSEPFSNFYDPSIQKQVYTSLGHHSQILKVTIP